MDDYQDINDICGKISRILIKEMEKIDPFTQVPPKLFSDLKKFHMDKMRDEDLTCAEIFNMSQKALICTNQEMKEHTRIDPLSPIELQSFVDTYVLHFNNILKQKKMETSPINNEKHLIKTKNEKSTIEMKTFEIHSKMENVFQRFHAVATQLKKRYDDRETLEVRDEYDVQDLLHAILKIHFDDIRPEEWTGSYAGKSSRMDFLLKKEQIVIEVKKTRDNIGEKEIGDQLIIDIDRYKEHKDCKILYCFVYDPNGIISNPRGLESDLSKKSSEITVKVYIYPKIF